MRLPLPVAIRDCSKWRLFIYSAVSCQVLSNLVMMHMLELPLCFSSTTVCLLIYFHAIFISAHSHYRLFENDIDLVLDQIIKF